MTLQKKNTSFDLRCNKRMIIYGISVALILAPCIWIGRAALAYFGDVSICLNPIKIVSDQERIENAARVFRGSFKDATKLRLQEPQHRSSYNSFVDNHVYQKMAKLNSSNCCRLLQDGWLGESKFGFNWALLHGITHFVVPVDQAMQFRGNKPNESQYNLYQLSNICGDVVSWPDDIYI